MLSVIQYAFNAVMPIILLILVGVLARRKGFLDPPMLRKLNKFNFRFNFFAMMFINLYEVESIRKMPIRMGIFLLAALTVLLFLGILVAGVFTDERFRKGVLIQAVFRSNYAIIGIPTTIALVGEAGGQMASFLQLPAVLFNNIISVLILSYYADYEAQYRMYGEGPLAELMDLNAADPDVEKKKKALTEKGGVNFGRIGHGLVTNPLVQGLMAGLFVLLLREMIPRGADGELVFSIQSDLPWLYSALRSLSQMATPLALVVLGGQLEMKEIGEYRKELIAGVFMRLVGAPLVGFGLLFAAVRLGLLVVGPVEIAVIVAVMGSPVAVSSVVMTSEMGGDSHLAGQLVVWSSILGMLSLFIMISILRMNGLL